MAEKAKTKRTYPVLAPVRHDGEAYEAGEFVSLTNAEGETLQSLGVVGEPRKEKADKGADGKDETKPAKSAAAKTQGGAADGGAGGGSGQA